MHWTETQLFKGINLNDSFILSWAYSSDKLSFQLEASIWPESKHYDTPKPNEHTCYKVAKLVFENYTDVIGLKDMAEVKPAIDASHELDYGGIDNLEILDGGYRLEGEFGEVVITDGSMRFEIGT